MKTYIITDTRNGLTLTHPSGHPLADNEMGGAVMFETMNDAMKFANMYAREYNQDVTNYIIEEIDLSVSQMVN